MSDLTIRQRRQTTQNNWSEDNIVTDALLLMTSKNYAPIWCVLRTLILNDLSYCQVREFTVA